MNKDNVEILIIGAGPAGLAAAISAYQHGIKSILIIERESEPGGILRQCIHNGFGLHRFKEELTGPEYAQRDIDTVRKLNIPICCSTTVLSVDEDHTVTCVSANEGFRIIHAKAIILAMGCREKTFFGLAGIGDLIVTATSQHSRNNRAGFLIGQGKSVDEAVQEIGMVVEGMNALPAAIALCDKFGMDMPLINAVRAVVNDHAQPSDVVRELMNRSLKME